MHRSRLHWGGTHIASEEVSNRKVSDGVRDEGVAEAVCDGELHCRKNTWHREAPLRCVLQVPVPDAQCRQELVQCDCLHTRSRSVSLSLQCYWGQHKVTEALAQGGISVSVLEGYYEQPSTCIFAMTVAFAISNCSSPERFLVFFIFSSSPHSRLCSRSHICRTTPCYYSFQIQGHLIVSGRFLCVRIWTAPSQPTLTSNTTCTASAAFCSRSKSCILRDWIRCR